MPPARYATAWVLTQISRRETWTLPVSHCNLIALQVSENVASITIRKCANHYYLMSASKWAHLRIRSVKYNQGFWIYLYFRIRHSFAHLRPVILSADLSISRLQSWTCSSLPTVAVFVKLTQSIVIEIQRQSADLYKVRFCGVHSDLRGKGIRVSPADIIKTIIDRFETHLPLRWLPLYRTVGRIHGWNHNSRFATRSCPPTLTVFIEVIWAYNLLWVLNESEFWSWKSGENFWTSCHKNLILTQFLKYLST